MINRVTRYRLGSMTKVFTSVIAAALMSWSLSAAAQTKINVRFGMLVAGADGGTQFVETSVVPNVVGQAYGWIATIEPRSEAVSWTEELRLPSPPRMWDAQAVSDDRKIARTRGVVQPEDGEFFSFWEITPGDPNGSYTVVVKVSDGVVAEFTFEVVEP